MFAVIESGGKQHRVAEGDSIRLELLPQKEGSTVEFKNILMISKGKDSRVGSPFLKDVKVTGEVIKHGKRQKIRVFKMKRRKGYRRTLGHRQSFTEVLIKKIDQKVKA